MPEEFNIDESNKAIVLDVRHLTPKSFLKFRNGALEPKNVTETDFKQWVLIQAKDLSRKIGLKVVFQHRGQQVLIFTTNKQVMQEWRLPSQLVTTDNKGNESSQSMVLRHEIARRVMAEHNLIEVLDFLDAIRKKPEACDIRKDIDHVLAKYLDKTVNN
jgi:hypothetical protein